jgi:uncharacterized protein DUF4238
MSEPRGHHQVAQFYQRGFARQRGKTWQVAVLDRRTGERRIQNVANTFKQRDWNTVKDEDGNMNFAVEKALAELVDQPAAAAFHQLREGCYPLGTNARRDVARFVSAQLTRGRHIRDNLTTFMVEIGQRMVSLAAQNYTDEQWQEAIGEVPTEEQRAQLIDNEKHFQLVPTAAGLLDPLLANVEEIAAMLERRSWTLVRFPEPWLFAGEHLVIHINPSGHEMGYGVATADQLYAPVSPTHALLMSFPWSRWPEALVNGTRELAERLNWATLIFPTSEQLLMHPDIARYPLPSIGTIAAGEGIWPWPREDSGGGHAPFHDHLARRYKGELASV